MDVARDAGPLFRHCAPELGGADRAPGADEDDRVGEHAQEVALRHPAACDERLEHELQRCEELEREAEGEPARDVLVPLAEPLAPADDGDEHDQRLERERAREVEGLRLACRNAQRGQ